MAFRLARLRDFGLTGLPSALLTWSQRVAEQIEAEVGALTEADAAMAAAIAAQSTANTAQTTATTAQTTADSKAKVTRATTAPASPNTGDVWVDSSVSPVITKTWNGTAWVVAATEGADLASNVSNNTLANVTDTASRKALATNAVQTSYIQNNAVTNPASAYSTGSVSVPNTNTWTDVQSAAITATGAPIDIKAFFFAGHGDCGNLTNFTDAQYRIVRGGTVIFGPVNVATFADSGTGLFFGTGGNFAPITDQPAAGSYTYKIQAVLNSLSGTAALAPTYRSLNVAELKK
jgi:hypothetical protein